MGNGEGRVGAMGAWLEPEGMEPLQMRTMHDCMRVYRVKFRVTLLFYAILAHLLVLSTGLQRQHACMHIAHPPHMSTLHPT